MDYPALSTWVDGEEQTSPIADGGRLVDPNTGEALADSRSSSPDQLDRAIAAADTAHRDARWRGLGPERRAELLVALADWIDARAEEIAVLDALNSGVPISVTRLFAGSNGDTLRGAAARAVAVGDSEVLPAEHGEVRLHRVPWGATALILPWNAPSAMAVKKLAFALAAGATTVMKPSSFSPWSAQLVVRGAHEVGIPAGVVNLVQGGGGLGRGLVADPRIAAIAMTGSTPTGRAIAAEAAPRFARLRLELGSNNPAIVRQDADLELAARSLTDGVLKLSGQWCEAPRRVLAPRALVADLVERLHAEFATRRMGSSVDPGTEVGPVAFEARRAELDGQLDRLSQQGARIVRAGTAPDLGGWFFDPAIAVVDGPGLDDEVFGPLLIVGGYDDETEALRLANTGQVGLAGYVYGADVPAAAALGTRLIAGEVKVNGSSVLDMAPASAQSFFGDSGLGGHGDADVLDFFVGKQVVGTDPAGLPL
ncbi:aldehyde dehydrogenase family protein [Agromyces aerolatus]|uniref:aldehyde dehydrogenase family protein n=1 Tax=Agromyces sp. LY-1074 TaxID=3074080 RepID=UPI00285A11D4|nr:MULTISPECIES: aldehyde dehydrogenase family protein [unclassified Agromyces]MDR5700427.1 aldehyde dehydrogenase family protein [Agromyces sp. LY-1074]MDR5706948.1 aldehyde dehydrogenase family protein [Agromyces sp. LY-1358]